LGRLWRPVNRLWTVRSGEIADVRSDRLRCPGPCTGPFSATTSECPKWSESVRNGLRPRSPTHFMRLAHECSPSARSRRPRSLRPTGGWTPFNSRGDGVRMTGGRLGALLSERLDALAVDGDPHTAVHTAFHLSYRALSQGAVPRGPSPVPVARPGTSPSTRRNVIACGWTRRPTPSVESFSCTKKELNARAARARGGPRRSRRGRRGREVR
jgi:hypothetical protein